jgi:hypothetical protein
MGEHSFRPDELISMGLGIGLTLLVLWFNRGLFGRGSGLSILEVVYYICAIAGLAIGYYFNMQYMAAYEGESGWAHWMAMIFTNPASASAAQDLTIANVILLPLWTIVDGRRRGMAAAWLYFPMSVFTSFAFAMALFLAFQERQIRANAQRAQPA